MNKKNSLMVLFIIFSITFCFGYEYWYKDVNSPRGLNERQRAYFFKELVAFETATGYKFSQFDWFEVNENTNRSFQEIFGTMRREGFILAFVLGEYETFFSPNTPYSYQFYLISNGHVYIAVKEYPRRIIMNN